MAPRNYQDDDDNIDDIAREPVPNHLTNAILVTLCCCLPFGIVGIVFASQANSAAAKGDYAVARKQAAQAQTWIKVAFICGLIAHTLNIIRVIAQLALMNR